MRLLIARLRSSAFKIAVSAGFDSMEVENYISRAPSRM
jgi:hypothetical protein